MEITLKDIIDKKVRVNDIIKWCYEQKHNVKLLTDTHGTYYIEDNKRVHLSYKDLREDLKDSYIRVGENKWLKI